MTEHMRRLGFSEYVVDWRELDPETFSAMVRKAWEAREAIRTSLITLAAEFRKEAANNARYILEPISGRRPLAVPVR